jgi:putative zinc finger/helix-turn-helix YgiT family protein
MNKCIQCGQADLVPKIVQLDGQVRGEHYTVEMLGLECPRCGYQTIEGPTMPEYRRLLADRYRATYGLLTSEDIRARRKRLRMNQREFAKYVNVGEATIKRAEMGKIQDRHTDEAIRRRTDLVLSATASRIGRTEAIVTSTNGFGAPFLGPDVTHWTLGCAGPALRHNIAPYLASQFVASTRGWGK